MVGTNIVIVMIYISINKIAKVSWKPFNSKAFEFNADLFKDLEPMLSNLSKDGFCKTMD